MDDPIIDEIYYHFGWAGEYAEIGKEQFRFKPLRLLTGRFDVIMFDSNVERLDLQISHAESLTSLIIVELPANFIIPKDWMAIKIKSIKRDLVLLTSDAQWVKWACRFLTETIHV